MPTQAQEIDGHVLLNDISAHTDSAALNPGDLVEVEISEAMPTDLVGRLVRVLKPAKQVGLKRATPALPGEWRSSAH
jgi:hypothetical protein